MPAANLKYIPQIPFVPRIGSSVKAIAWIAGGAAVIYLGYKINKKIEEWKIAQENKEVATDPNKNIASQIFNENRAFITNDEKMIELFRQIKDYPAVNKSYARYGYDMLQDTSKNVSSDTYQQILNIIGVKGGAIKADSTVSEKATKLNNVVQWIVTKVDARLRKSPKAGSAITFRSNIIETIKSNILVGFIDHLAIFNNKGKLFYDDANNVYYIPIRVFDGKDLKKTLPAYIAASTVNIIEGTIPKNLKLYRVSEFLYNLTNAVSGLTETTINKSCKTIM